MTFPASTGAYQITASLSDANGNKPTQPFIIPPEYGPGPVTSPTQVAVQVAGAAGPKFDAQKPPVLPVTSPNPPNSDFALTWSGDTAVLTAGNQTNNHVWNLDAASRTALKNNFDLMYGGLEALEYGEQLAVGMAFILSQQMAEALPLALNETLLFRYNFTPVDLTNTAAAHGYVDLVPGMRLRIEAAGALYNGTTANPFNGFVGSGTSYWQIRRQRPNQATLQQNPKVSQNLLFDAFAGVINNYQSTTVQGGAWGLVDLQSAGYARYYRLFYPPAAFASWPGSYGTSSMCTLIGTQSLADLQTATTAYTGSQPVPAHGQDKDPIACTFFRGRTIIVPEIPIRVNDATVWVPLGTTVRQFVETYAIPSFTSSSSPPVSCYRVWSPADLGAWGSGSPGLIQQVQGLQDGAFPGGIDAWDLPLVKGDSLLFSFSV